MRQVFGHQPNALQFFNLLEIRRSAPRVGFEPTACRLTADGGKNLSALSGVLYEKSGAIFPSQIAPIVRLRELGIRMALGAQRKEVLQAALGRPFKLLAFGSGAGLVLGILARRVLASIVYQATPRDPLVLSWRWCCWGCWRRGFQHNARCRLILRYCCVRSELVLNKGSSSD